MTCHIRIQHLGICPIYGTDMDRGRKCEACRECTPPTPPTLREWLGDRVSDLGPWADVLRDQPVPAGMIVRWTWVRDGAEWLPEWTAKDGTSGHLLQHEVTDAVRDDLSCLEFHDWAYEAVQMALFSRHPDVKPDPRPLRTWFGNEEEV